MQLAMRAKSDGDEKQGNDLEWPNKNSLVGSQWCPYYGGSTVLVQNFFVMPKWETWKFENCGSNPGHDYFCETVVMQVSDLWPTKNNN